MFSDIFNYFNILQPSPQLNWRDSEL